MMICFPMAYDDEALYSLISRYEVRSGNVSHKATLSDVFGSENFTASLELQSGIGRIMSNLPAGCTLREDSLILKHTMFLFHTAFRSQEQADSIYSEMIGEHGQGIHNAIGLMSSSIKPHYYFQYCPLCNEECLNKEGELYWRRLFQIPSVQICLKHKVWLCKSNIQIRGTTKYVFTAPTQENCPGNDVKEITDIGMLERYGCIVNDIERLLNFQFPNHSINWFYLCYKQQLIQRGYASEKGRVDFKRVKRDFIDYFGVNLLDVLQSAVHGESNWLKLIFQKHRKGFHPVRHLLVMHFLGLTLDDVFYADGTKLEIGYGLQTKRSKRKIMKKNMTDEYREQARNQRRELWILLRKDHPQFSRLELRKLNPKVYSWLYLYDRKFLMSNMPEMLSPKSGSVRYDWQKRDREMFILLTEIIERIKNEEVKPRRLTLTHLQVILGKQCLMPKHLKKMPKTKKYLEQVVENSESFRKRRVHWAIQELKKDGKSLTKTNIRLKAGVSKVDDFLVENNESLS